MYAWFLNDDKGRGFLSGWSIYACSANNQLRIDVIVGQLEF